MYKSQKGSLYDFITGSDSIFIILICIIYTCYCILDIYGRITYNNNTYFTGNSEYIEVRHQVMWFNIQLRINAILLVIALIYLLHIINRRVFHTFVLKFLKKSTKSNFRWMFPMAVIMIALTIIAQSLFKGVSDDFINFNNAFLEVFFVLIGRINSGPI